MSKMERITIGVHAAAASRNHSAMAATRDRSSARSNTRQPKAGPFIFVDANRARTALFAMALTSPFDKMA